MRHQRAAHESLKKSTALLSVASNTLLVVLKLAVGIFTGAVSIISEAAHSGVDLLAALVAYMAVKESGKPPDVEHAYGHGKIENLSAAFEAFLIIAAAVWIVYEAVDKLAKAAAPEFLEYGIAVMLFSMAVNYGVSARLYKVAVLTESQALEADALHLRADVWTCGGVLVGLIIMKITGYYWLDPVIAIIVAGIILVAGYNMTKKNIYELTDVSLSEEEEEIIYGIANSHPQVISSHKLRTRRSGSNKIIDMHLILRKDMHLDEAHAVCDEIEANIKIHLHNCDITIHLEPCNNYHDGFDQCPADCPFQDRKRDGKNSR